MSPAPPWKVLEWDSRFFGFGVGRLEAVPRSAESLHTISRAARATGLQLLYATCAPDDLTSRSALREVGAALADMKRTYAASVPSASSTSGGESVFAMPAWPHPCERRQLRALAWQAAAHSRFKTDPRMPPGTWRRMYSTWIANSLNGGMADQVLATRSSHELTAMVTVALRAPSASIGLLAVQHGHRGRGLGRRLVDAAFDAARDAGLQEVSVVTQASNTAACRTYEACGMSLAEEQCIFHLWTDQ